MESLLARRSRKCDVLRMTHRDGVIYYINLLSVGFAADVATVRARSSMPTGSWVTSSQSFTNWRGSTGVRFH